MSFRLVFVAAWTSVFWAPSVADEPSKTASPDKVFGLTQMHRIHLTVSAMDYATMDPPPRVNPFGGGGAVRPGPGGADIGAGNFGFEFQYVHAAFDADGRAVPDVALRYKGSGTYLVSQRAAKRSLKIDFDRYDSGAHFHGLKKLNLNSGVMDPTKVREVLAYGVFRTAGVPAARTAFAEVTLTVPGKYDKECLGLYTVVEQVDERFLKRHFQKGDGLLLKPEGIRGVPYLGEDPKAYEKPYNVKSKEGSGDWKRLIEFTRLVNKSSDAEFQRQISSYLDLDNFVRLLAANSVLASMDGFIGLGHNYYLYLSPVTNKFSFFPWDLDLAFGAFGIYGNAEQLSDLSVDHPHVGENKLIDRLLAMPDIRAKYREQVARLAKEEFHVRKLSQDLEKVEQIAKPLIAKETKAALVRRDGGGFGGPGMGGMFGGMPLQSFIEKRAASIAAQLDGKKKGYVPSMMGFGPPGGFGPPNPLARPLFESLDVNKDGKVSEAEYSTGMKRLFSEWDKNKDEKLDQREIADGLQKLMPSRGFGPPAVPRPPRP